MHRSTKPLSVPLAPLGSLLLLAVVIGCVLLSGDCLERNAPRPVEEVLSHGAAATPTAPAEIIPAPILPEVQLARAVPPPAQTTKEMTGTLQLAYLSFDGELAARSVDDEEGRRSTPGPSPGGSILRPNAAGPARFARVPIELNGVTYAWDGGGPDNLFSTATNWNPDVPPANDGTADLHFAGTVRPYPVAEVPYSLNSLNFDASAGTFLVSGGTLTLGAGGIAQNSTNAQTINNALILGTAQTWTLASSAGSLTLGPGAIVDNGGFLLTVNAPTGRSVVFNGALGGAGGLTLSGAGTVTLAGPNTFRGAINVNAGTLTLAASGSTYFGGAINVGAGAALVINGSIYNLTSSLTVDGTSGSPATATQGTGSSIRVSEETIGLNGTGTFMQAGGYHSVSRLSLGENAGSSGTYTQTGGVLSASTGLIGYKGTGTFTLAGGTNTTGSTLYLGYNSSASGTYNLNGGLLRVGGIARGSGNGTFNFNGGILSTFGFSTTFLQGLSAANVLAGGARVDTNGYDLTITQPLLHGASTDGGLTKLGGGTLTLIGVSTYTGTTTVDAGTLKIGAGASLYGLTGTALTFSGSGTFNLAENPGLAQGMGALTFSAGEGVVQSTYAGSSNTSLTFASLATRAVGAVGNFVVSGGTNGSTNRIVLGGQAAGFINQGTFFGGGNYAWENTAGGYVREMVYGSDAGATSYGAGTTVPSTTHAQITGNINTQATGTAFTTLKIAGDYNLALASGATVTTNGLLKAGGAAGGSSTISGGTALQTVNGGELIIRTDTVDDSLTINTPIKANGSNVLTKSGAGTLTLGGAETYTGPTYVDGGTLTFAAGSSLAGGGLVWVRPGATLNVNGSVTINGSVILTPVGGGVAATINSGGALTAYGETVSGAGTFAQTGGTNTVNGDFNLATNFLGNSTYALSGGALSTSNEYVGYNGPGVFTQSGGTNTTNNNFYVGYLVGSSGSYTLDGGAEVTLSAPYETIGYNGVGAFTQNGGTNTAAYGLYISNSTNDARGSYTLNAGALSSKVEYVGGSSAGTFTQTGGTNTITGTDGQLYVGNASTSNSSYALSGTGALTGADEIIGYVGVGAFTQSGGTNTITRTLYLGYNAAGNGSYTLSGAAAVALSAPLEYIGYSGAGTFTQTGGTHTVGNGGLYLGYNGYSSGSYALSGTGALSAVGEYVGNLGVGTFTQTGGTNTISGTLALANAFSTGSSYSLSGGAAVSLSAASEIIGVQGVGTFNQSGGTNTASGGVYLGYNSGSRGTFNLNGGTLQTSAVIRGDGIGIFNFNGGTLQARINSTTFFQGLTAANVLAGGAFIDTNGRNITIAQTFLHGAATDGGLTKTTGAGTLTLTAANAYTGPTAVNAGTLLAGNTTGSATGTGAVSVSNAGTLLGGTGFVAGPVTVNNGAGVLGGNGTAATGALTLQSALTLNSSSFIELVLGPNGTHSTLARVGTGAWTFADNQAFTFLDAGGAQIGTYDNIITGLSAAPSGVGSWTITNSKFAGSFNYDGAGNIDLNVTAVPEPATWLAGALTLAAGYTLRRRAYPGRRA